MIRAFNLISVKVIMFEIWKSHSPLAHFLLHNRIINRSLNNHRSKSSPNPRGLCTSPEACAVEADYGTAASWRCTASVWRAAGRQPDKQPATHTSLQHACPTTYAFSNLLGCFELSSSPLIHWLSVNGERCLDRSRLGDFRYKEILCLERNKVALVEMAGLTEPDTQQHVE